MNSGTVRGFGAIFPKYHTSESAMSLARGPNALAMAREAWEDLWGKEQEIDDFNSSLWALAY